MLTHTTLLLAASAITNSLAIVSRDTTCCPNGTYPDDLHLACHGENNTNFALGDGQCYQSGGVNWQIQCTETFNSADIINSSGLPTRGTGEIWYYDTCFSFCEANAPGFTSINIQTGESSDCQCLRLASNTIGYKFDTVSASSMIQCPLNDQCCEPYTGDVTNACTQDAANAQGKCVTVNNNPFIINCDAVPYSFATSYLEQGVSDFGACLNACEAKGGSNFNAVVFEPGANGDCSCGTQENSFAAGGSNLYSLFQTPFGLCSS
jgi:hypothetical protein